MLFLLKYFLSVPTFLIYRDIFIFIFLSVVKLEFIFYSIPLKLIYLYFIKDHLFFIFEILFFFLFHWAAFHWGSLHYPKLIMKITIASYYLILLWPFIFIYLTLLHLQHYWTCFYSNHFLNFCFVINFYVCYPS